ncbi:MAG: hypothetical protein V4574_06220 [Pseudomonadota bacterium]
MAGPYAAHILNRATSQNDRKEGAPAPEGVNVDDRSLAQLLAFAANYGALICFYDLDNTPNGDWVEFFATDPAIAEALHASLNLPEIERMLRELLKEARRVIGHPGRVKPLMRIFKVVARLLAILDRAQIRLGDIEAMLKRFVPEHRSDGVRDPLKRLRGHIDGGSLEQDLAGDGDEGRDGKWHGTLIDILEDLAGSLIDELRSGIAGAQAALEKSLEIAEHEPQGALYNAFVAMFIESRAEMNKFPRRLVDFYYGDVLDQQALAPTPDQLFLTFTQTAGVDQASVPRGALFPAGEDSKGAAINYAATTSLEVTPAAVSEVSVHRVTHTKIDIGGGLNVSVPSGVLAGTVKLDPGNPNAATPFPLFGGPDAQPVGNLTMQRATLGFCIASPVLMLTGGHRTVEIGLTVSLLTPPSPSGPHLPGMIKGDVDALSAAIQKTLSLHYSTAGGWMLVEEFHVTPSLMLGSDDGATLFTVAFQLPPDAPPLVSLTETAPANAPPPTLPAGTFPDEPQQPAVVANLNLDGGVQQDGAFMLLSQVQFEHISLDVFVDGLEQLTLTTPNGPADTSQNFSVFGLPPAQYSALEIYAPELFVKPIEALSVSITWVGLPVTSTGFKGYYQNYLLDADGNTSTTSLFDNTSFRVGFSVDNPGYWDVADGPSSYLFQTGPDTTGTTPPPSSGAYPASQPPAPAAPVRRTSWLGVRGIGTQTAPAYYNPTASALKVTLAEPVYAFGNILYTSNLMAASMSQTAAALENARNHDAQTSGGASAQVANLAKVNATAPDKNYTQTVSTAVHSAVSSLTGEAMAAVQQGVAQSGAPTDTQAGWLTDLEKAISAAAAASASAKGSWWGKLLGQSKAATDVAAVVDSVKAWIATHEAALGEHAAPAIGRAQSLLSAAGNVAATHSAAAAQPVAVARPSIAAASQQAQVVVLPPALPNPPWLPMASSVKVNYAASINAPITVIGDDMPALSGSATINPAVTASDGNPLALDFWHIGPFGVLKTPTPASTGGVSVLPPVEGDAALYIQLSVPVDQISLLFVLEAGPNGWWDDPPTIRWEQRIGGVWQDCKLLDDTTGGLKNSGIVTLGLIVPLNAAKAPRLRARAIGTTENAPMVQCVIANALTARWEGPGGAAGLGTPLAAGTITKSQSSLAGIASIAQPMASFGGSPPAIGPAFQMWMAERLRHKGYAIDSWDYARIILAAVPSLWQAAVVPAINETDGQREPGMVWIVAVAGPNTPNVSDATVPQVDLATLSEIGDTLRLCTSSFAQVAVTNPPYLRLIVTATVEFTADDTSAFWEDQLNTDLIAWLSPWPPSPTLGKRPDDYYTRRSIAEFIRGRSYVLGIASLEITPEATAGGNGHFYLTSATQHAITTAPPDGLELPPQRELYPADEAE